MATMAKTIAPAMKSILGLFDWERAMKAIMPTDPSMGTTEVSRLEALGGSSRSGGGSRASSPCGRVGMFSSTGSGSCFFLASLAMSPPNALFYRLIIPARAVGPLRPPWEDWGTGRTGTRRRTRERIHAAANPNRMS